MKKVALLTAILFLAMLAGCREGARSGRPAKELAPTRYDLTATLLPQENALSLRAEVEYSCPLDDLAAVKFRLYPNAYRKCVVTEDKKAAAYPHGRESYGSAELSSVSCSVPVADSDVGEDGTLLTVRLDRKLKRGERVRFVFEESVTLACVKHRLGYSDGYFFLSDFYPEVCPFSGGRFLSYDPLPYGDPFRFDNACFSLALTLPVGYECACSASETDRSVTGDAETRVFSAESTREIALVVSKKLRRATTEACGVKISYYCADGSDKQKTLDVISDGISYFSERFGNFPYSSYSVVAAPFFEAGVEHAGLAVANKDLPFSARKKTILHETAHQWWFGKVGVDQVLSPWMDEGLAEYSTASYYLQRGFAAVYREMISDAEDAFSIRLALKGSEGARFDLPLTELADGYYDRVYTGGLLLFATLSEVYGIDAFHRALKAFADRFQGAVASPEDLVLSLSSSLGKDLFPFFRARLTATVPIQ